MVTEIRVRHWDEQAHGPIGPDAIRRLHVPPQNFRVSEYRYPAGANFPGGTHAGLLYVLRGRCRYTSAGDAVELGPGDIAERPEGRFELEVLGADELVVVKVWELPPTARRPV